LNLSQEKILITGGTGFLGSNLAHHLVQKIKVPPQNLRIFYLNDTSTKALEDLPKLDMYPGNILDKESLRKACQDCTIIFHTVGSTTFEPRLKKIQWLINVEGTRNLLQIAKESNSIKRICYTSTVNTLGCPNPKGSIGTIETSNPYTNKPRLHTFKSPEHVLKFADSIYNGTSPKKWWKKIGIGYFDSKLAAQELVNRAVKEDNLDIVSILPGTFFGPYDIFIGTGMYLLRIYNNSMPGVLRGGGLPCLHVEDVVRGHILAVQKGKTGERYIITGEEKDNLYLIDVVKIIGKVLKEKEPKRDIRLKFIQISPFFAKIGATLVELFSKLFKKPCVLSRGMVKGGSYPSFYSYEKAKKELGYNPQKSFREAIEDMYDYYKKNNFLIKKDREFDIILMKKEKGK